MSYNPSKKNAKWLDWLLNRIKAVPYEIPSRWAFYRLVEEFNFTKKQYKKFLMVTSKARKNYYNGYSPTTFVDDTREMINAYGSESKYEIHNTVLEWLDEMVDKSPYLKVEKSQDTIVFVCFEAKAMSRQFKHYLEKYRVCLVPFGGDPSIHYKHKLAKLIEEAKEEHDKPIKVLYFGDYDPKGMEIPLNAMKDIRQWTDAEFEFIRLGINSEHVEELGIIEDPDHPGKFQWEALDEHKAEKLINLVFEHWDRDAIDKIKSLERKAGNIWSSVVEDAIDQAKAMLEEETGT